MYFDFSLFSLRLWKSFLSCSHSSAALVHCVVSIFARYFFSTCQFSVDVFIFQFVALFLLSFSRFPISLSSFRSRRICAVRFSGVAIARKIKEIIISWTISLSRAATRKIDNTKRNISVLKQHAKRPYSRNFSALKKTNISSKSHTNRTPTTANFSMHRELEKRDRERESERKQTFQIRWFIIFVFCLKQTFRG